MTPVRSIYEKLHEMGELICDRASRRGVANLDYELHEGDIKLNLRQIAIGTHADILVKDRPIHSPGSNVFNKENFAEFIKSLEADTDPHIIVVSPEPADGDVNASPHGILPPEE